MPHVTAALFAAILVLATRAPVLGEEHDDPCCCPTPPSVDTLPAAITGGAMLATGVVLPLAHAWAAPTRSPYDLVPVVGPLRSGLGGHESADWAAAMVFAAWAQLVGSAILAVALTPAPAELPRRHDDDDGVALQVRF